MNQQPDHLFRTRLEHYQQPAPTQAWDRIEAQLDKSPKTFWLKIAAGFAVLVTASVIVFTATDNISSNEIADKKTIPPQSSTPESLSMPLNKEEAATKEVKPQELVRSDRKLVWTRKEEPAPEVTQQNIVAQGETQTEVEVINVTEPSEVSTEATTGVMLVITAEEVNSKYLIKKEEQEATPELKRSSRFQKLAGLAYNFTSGESALGDLREKKNEIFALNFLSDKKEQEGAEKKN